MTGALTIKKSISGTSWATDSGSLKITTNEASNPYVLGLAINSDGYGEIQTSQVTVGHKPLILQKKGGVVGIKTSSPDTSASLYASGIIMSDTNFTVKTPGIDLSASDNGVSSTNWPGLFIKDKDGRTSVQYLAGTYANGDNKMFLTVRNYDTSGNEVCNKGLGLTVNKSGTGTWWVSETASFRAALGIGSIYPLNLTTATANRFAYFSSTTAITSTGYMAYIPNVTVTTNSISRVQNGFRIWGSTYGNNASSMLSGIVGKFSYGDGGPQIQFGTSASGGQQGALIYTDNDCSYSAGVVWAFVSDQSDWNVQSKRFVAWDSITIGYRASSSACYKPNTSYALYNAGSTYLVGNIKIGRDRPWLISAEGTAPDVNVTLAPTNGSKKFIFKDHNGNNCMILSGGDNTANPIVTGFVEFPKPIKLSVATGTAPMTVTSTTLVSNLNADMLDGYHASDFLHITFYDTNNSNAVAYFDNLYLPLKNVSSGNAELDLPFLPLTGGTLTSTNQQVLELNSTNATSRTSLKFKHSGTEWGGLSMSAQNGSLQRYTSGYIYYNIWDAGNDGSGSGLDADLLDGYHSSSFILANTADGIATVSGGGSNWYFRIATINITASYINRPVAFEISQRGYEFSVIQVIFNSANNSDPTLKSFTTDNVDVYYIKKVATSKWEIYGKYNEVYGSATLHRITGCGANIGVTVNMVNIGTDDPTGTTKCQKLHLGRLETANWAYGADEAYELTTPRLIWGQSFDGTANVSGNMTGVTNVDSLLYFDTTNSRVGIGTSSPSTKFEINGGSNGTPLKLTTTTTYSCINYKQSSGANWSAGSNNSSYFYFWNSTKNATVAYFNVNGKLTCYGIAYNGLTNPGNYVFTCDGSYVAKSSLGGGSSGITVSTVTLASTSYYPMMVTGTGSKTTAYIANPSSGAKFYATSSGVYFTSDIQLKTNISRYFVHKELTENPVRKFDWKNGGGNNIIGFVAQEVEQWCPEAIHISEDGYKSLNYNATLSALCGYLFDKVKELENTIKILKEQLNANKC